MFSHGGAVVWPQIDGIAVSSICAFVPVLWQAFSVKPLIQAHRDPRVSGQASCSVLA